MNESELLAFRDWLTVLLQERSCTIEFVKSDGTLRTMLCTLQKSVIPVITESVGDKKSRKVNPDVLAIWSIDDNGWRSFRLDSVKSVHFTLANKDSE